MAHSGYGAGTSDTVIIGIAGRAWICVHLQVGNACADCCTGLSFLLRPRSLNVSAYHAYGQGSMGDASSELLVKLLWGPSRITVMRRAASPPMNKELASIEGILFGSLFYLKRRIRSWKSLQSCTGIHIACNLVKLSSKHATFDVMDKSSASIGHCQAQQ